MQTLGSNANLHRIGLELGLERFINTPGLVSAATVRSVADTVEAILGAIYLDSGLEDVKDVMDALGLVPRERMAAAKEEEPEVIVIDDDD